MDEVIFLNYPIVMLFKRRVVMRVYKVIYEDDNHKMHMAFVSSLDEVRFIRRRFENVTFEMI